MAWLAFLSHGRRAAGADAVLGVVLRIAGTAGLLLLAPGLLMAGMGLWTLGRLEVQGDRTGWDGLIGGIALMLGVMMVLGGALLAVGCHAAFSGWRDQRPRPVRIAGWTFAAVGVLGIVPAMLFGIDTPLDLYVTVAGAFVAGLGVWMVAWAHGHAAS